jgi:hypothetical protein
MRNGLCHRAARVLLVRAARMLLTSLAFALALAAAQPVWAESGTPATTTTIGTYAIPTVTAPPELDPKADAATWKDIAPVALGWDVQHQRPSSESTQARLATDGTSFYARFDVKQREGLLQTQHANNIGDGTDDEVWVDLWPNGNKGFYYQFAATSNGTHFQYSSENTSYQPTWQSYGATYAGGFTVTMKIPLDILRGTGGGSDWRVQFVRIVRSTGERQIWSYAPAQSNGDDVTFAGFMRGMAPATASRAKPRVGVYALGEAGSSASGLSTSRTGADFSLPITQTASLFGTIHPDFSNVEIDQQTIAPTAFQRFYTEVRPFFTQADNYYDNFDCDACPGIENFYSPNIPTPREGYAIGGHQGQIQFAALDSVGASRTDEAQSFGYTSPDNRWRYFMERISADCNQPGTENCQNDLPFVHDDTFANGLAYSDGKHVDAYVDYGSDSGSNVLIPDRAQRYDTGAFLYDQNEGVAFSTRKVGLYYDPADGLVQHPDIAGYAIYGVKLWTFDKHSPLNSFGVSSFVDRYHNMFGALDQTDTSITLDALTKSRIDVQGTIGSSYLLQQADCTLACIFTPVSQNGVGVTYHSGTVNSPGNFPNHGSSSTPTSIAFNTGRFGPGKLDSWTRGTTMVAGQRGTISFEADDTRQYLDRGGINTQWLERAGYTYAASADSSFAIGVRRIIGTPPLVFAATPVSCTTVATLPYAGATSPCSGAWNLAFSYHHRSPHDEIYFGYGDSSELSTTHSFIFKIIHYFGAEKGT